MLMAPQERRVVPVAAVGAVDVGGSSVYLLYWYKRTNTDAEGALLVAAVGALDTCFISTKYKY